MSILCNYCAEHEKGMRTLKDKLDAEIKFRVRLWVDFEIQRQQLDKLHIENQELKIKNANLLGKEAQK